jgi:class 3 adenylate cyclase
MRRILFILAVSGSLMLHQIPVSAGLTVSERIDSLLSVLAGQKSDSNKVNTLNEISWEYYANGYDGKKAVEYANEALLLAQSLGYKRGEATAYRRLGGIVINQGHYNEAFRYYTREMDIQRELGDKRRVASGYMQIGSVFFYIGNYPVALRNYLAGLKLAEEVKDHVTTCRLSNNIAKIYSNMGDYDEALKYYTTALKIYEESGDKEGVAKECVGIGDIFLSQKNYTDALIYFRKSLDIAEKSGMKRLAATCYIDIGETYSALGDYEESLRNLLKGLEISRELGDPYIAVHLDKSIGWAYFNMKKWDDARKFLNEALSKSVEMGLTEAIEYCYYRLSKLDSATGNYHAAFANYKNYILQRDRIINSETVQKLAQQKMQYEFEKTNALKKAEQERKDLWQQIIRYSFLAGLIIATAFLLVVFRQRNKIRAEKKISEEARSKVEAEKERSEELLLNILPAEVAEEIKLYGHSKPKTFSMVTVLFADFKDFTSVSERYSAELLVAEIDHCFSAFDHIVQKNGVEKIKTIGDAYICVGGMPVLTTTHAIDIVNTAIEIRDFMLARKKQQEATGGIFFELRLGVHSGPVVAGIVGVKKYAYDIWGDTVNFAARMEENSEAGKINISGTTWKLVKDKFDCTYRGKIEAKNKGEVEMYYAETLNQSAQC